MANLNVLTGVTLTASVLALAACNDSSSDSSPSFGGGSAPNVSTEARSGAELSSDNLGDISASLVTVFQGDLGGGAGITQNSLSPRSLTDESQARFSPEVRTAYEETLWALENRFWERYQPNARSLDSRSTETFDEYCQLGGNIQLNESSDTVTLDFNDCVMGQDADNYAMISGNMRVTGAEDVDTSGEFGCVSEVNGEFEANDVWFRSYVNGDIQESLFLTADLEATYNGQCNDNGMPTGEFDSSLEGSHFVVAVNDEFAGMFDIDMTAANDEHDTASSSVNVTFDSSELPGSIDIFTEEDEPIVVADGSDYPKSGIFGITDGTTTVTFEVKSAEPTDTDAVRLVVSGDFSCDIQMSWEDLEKGDFECS